MDKNIFLVDADNTLLDFHASSILSLQKAFEHFSVVWKEEYGETFTRLNDELWESLERKEITRAELIATRFPRYLKMLGFDKIDGEKYNEIFLQSLSLLPVYVDGAQDFLLALRKKGRVYIVTNGTTSIQKSRFAICKLNDYADDVFVSETIGYNKPAPEYTAYVINHIDNFEKEKAVWIGDSLSADVKAANDAKITSIWFNPSKIAPNGEANPDFIVDNFDKILHILGI